MTLSDLDVKNRETVTEKYYNFSDEYGLGAMEIDVRFNYPSVGQPLCECTFL